MEEKSKKKILFVINPKSGFAGRDNYKSAISRASERRGFQWKIYETNGQNDPDQIRRHLNEFNPGKVISIGGDGTVNMVGAELLGTDIGLGIIPMGSANGLAHNLRIPLNFKRALDYNLETTARPMDVIQINNRYYCLHLSDIGINARIVRRFEKEGSKGLIGYAKQLFKELMEGKTCFSFYIEIPGQRRKKMKAEMLVIANAKSFGTGAIINPSGKMDDGKFELIIIRPYPWWFVFTFIYAAFTGKLHKMKYVKFLSVSEAAITLPEPHECQIDGEIIPATTFLKVGVLPRALNVIGV